MRLDKNYCVGAKYTSDGNALILESCDFITRSGYSIKMTWFYSYKTGQIWGRRRASEKKMCWTEGGIIPNSMQKSGKTKKSSPESQSFIYLTECKKSYSAFKKLCPTASICLAPAPVFQNLKISLKIPQK